jgi:chromate transporter
MRHNPAPLTSAAPHARDAVGSIFLRFLKFGALAWGGPAAQIAMIKRECVDEEEWVSEETFKKTLAVYQVLPGPEAHELCVYFGRIRGGKVGAFAAGLGFMLPGFVLMLALSILYVEANLAGHLDELFYGLTAAVGAIVARALVRLSGTFITDPVLAVLAAAAFALTLFADATFVLVLLGAGLAYELWTNAGRWTRRANSFSLGPAVLVLVTAASVSLTAETFWEGLKAGLLTFGGAFTVIPFLQQSSVEVQHWLTDDQFVDGLAMSGILPAPLIIFSTFVGYVAGGLAGALAMTLGIFIPAFVFPIFLHRALVAVAENPRIRPFLLGVAAGVIGLIAAVTVDIVDASVVDVPTAILAVGGFVALNLWHGKLTVLYVVLGWRKFSPVCEHVFGPRLLELALCPTSARSRARVVVPSRGCRARVQARETGRPAGPSPSLRRRGPPALRRCGRSMAWPAHGRASERGLERGSLALEAVRGLAVERTMPGEVLGCPNFLEGTPDDVRRDSPAGRRGGIHDLPWPAIGAHGDEATGPSDARHVVGRHPGVPAS